MNAPWIVAPPSTSSDCTSRSRASVGEHVRDRGPPLGVPDQLRWRRPREHRGRPGRPRLSRQHDAQRAAAPPPGQPHRQPRIVGAHRPRPDQHRVVRGAQLVRGPPRLRPGQERRRAPAARRCRRRCSRPASPPPSASPAAAARAPRSRRRGSPRGSRVSRQPTSTRTPARRSRAMPPPSTIGFGSPQPTTTRASPAASTTSVHGPVRPDVATRLQRHVQRRAARRPPRTALQRVDLARAARRRAGGIPRRRCVRRARPPRRRPGSAARWPRPRSASASARRMKRSSAALNGTCARAFTALRAVTSGASSRPGS